MPETDQGPAAALYARLSVNRQPYLDRARTNSRYTLPALIPPEGITGASELYKPFQSIGARCVNNLSAKLALTLIPPTRRFYRIVVTEKLQKQIPTGQESEWELALSGVEASMDRRMEQMGIRPAMSQAFPLLIVGGNALVYCHKEGARVFPLSQYVVRRNGHDEVEEIVIVEQVCKDELPESAQAIIATQVGGDQEGVLEDDEVDLYTHVYQEKKTWKVYQEVHGVEIEGSRGSLGRRCPYLPLRWIRKDGEDYGRSHCDDYIGDLIACESLSRSIIRFAAIAAKVVFLVSPNGMTDPADLVKAEEGEFVTGQEEDITSLGLDKAMDFQVANTVLGEIVSRLSYAFLLNSAVRRQGERVTAEEIRYMAGELEDALGGVYSILSQEFQLPLVQIVQAIMTRDGSLPPLPDKSVRPTIITGIDALGRSHELARLDAFVQGVAQAFGPEALALHINVSDYLLRRAAGLDIENSKALIRSEQAVTQIRQQAAQQAMAEKVGPNVVKAVSDHSLAQQQPTGQTQAA
jgi:hypothetical protein